MKHVTQKDEISSKFINKACKYMYKLINKSKTSGEELCRRLAQCSNDSIEFYN